MTVNTKKITSGPYIGNDIADTFSYTFKIEDKSQLSVYETDDIGTQTILTVDTGYTVTGVGVDGGGTVTRLAGPLPTGYEWYIRSNYEETQLTAFQSQGAFFPDLHENAMDKLTILIQQILDSRDRSPRVDNGYSGPLPLTMEYPEAGKSVKWSSDLSGFVNYTPPNQATDVTEFGDVTGLEFSSVQNMLNGVLVGGGSHTFTPGEKCSSGGTLWGVVSVSSPMTLADFKCLSQYAHSYDWGVRGDAGATINDTALQQAFDDQRDYGLQLIHPLGDIHYQFPVFIWHNQREDTKTANPVNVGYGRGLTRFIKITRAGTTRVNHSGVDACIILANDITKAGDTIGNVRTLDSACYFGTLGHMDVVGQSPDATRVGLGVYSLGLFYTKFDDVEYRGVETAMATEWWNVFTKFIKQEFQLVGNACDFGRTDFGSNSNLYFEQCHCNGVNGFCYSILANATFYGCTIDGGGGKHYVIPGVDRGAAGILGGAITLIDCKSESPAIFENNPMFDLNYGQVNVKNSSLMIPTINYTAASRMIECSNYSKFVTDDARINLRVGDNPSLGALYSVDGTSRVNFDSETFVDTEWFDQYKKVFYRQSDKRIIGNRDKNGVTVSDITKFIYSVSGSVPVGERTVTSVSFASNRIQIGCTQANGHTMANGIMFNQAIDLTDYSKIYIQGDVDFVEGDVTGVNYQVYINSSLIADGSVGVGTPLPMSFVRATTGEVPGNFNSTNFNRYVDVSDIEGVYYIGVELFGININSNIQEISLIR